MGTMGATTLQVVVLVWLFALGLIVGSFLNVCVWRIPRGEVPGKPRRSYCPGCGRLLPWYENIPLLSFIILGGHCRGCGEAISWRYPAVELLTGLLFPLVYYRQGVIAGAPAGHLIVMMLVTGLLIIAGAIDMEFLIIPDEVTIFGILGGLLAGLLLPSLHVGTAPYHTFQAVTGNLHVDGLVGAAVGALGGGAIVLFWAVLGFVMFQREALGMGDVKLMAMVGAFFGWKVVLIGFFFGPFLGLLYGIPLLMMEGEHVMPFGPFLALASVLTIIFRGSMTAYLVPIDHMLAALTG